MKTLITTLTLSCFICLYFLYSYCIDRPYSRPKTDRIELSMDYPSNELNRENVYAEIMICDIKFSSIVLAQALLETRYFASYNCLTRNNLFGMTGGKKTPDNIHGFKIYDHWRHSVLDYKIWQKKRLTDECYDYYKFLVDWKYAEDPRYIEKLKSIEVKVVIK